MRALWTFHRRAVIAAAAAAIMVVATVTAATSSRPSAAARRPSIPPGRQDPTTGAGSPARAPAAIRPYTPSLLDPPDTPVQRQVDAELSKAESPAAIAAAEAIVTPSPAASRLLPGIPANDRIDATDYATAFATELLDINYATATRDGLLAWVESQEADNTLPGVPASVAGKALYASVAYPDLPGGTPSPIPSATGWAGDATAGLVDQVSNLRVTESPEWTSVTATGWQPRDELMSIQVVTGTLSTATPGQPPTTMSFSLTLTLGSAADRPGLGAVAVSQWQVG